MTGTLGCNLTRTHDKQQHNPNRTPITITQRFRSLKRSRTESKKEISKFQKNYKKTNGERWNYKQLKKLFLESDVFCDSGYDGEENIEFIQTSTINFISHDKKNFQDK